MKTVDLAKFSKEYTKKTNIKTGFYDPEIWIDTGAYVLNKIISGSFRKGIPLEGKVTVLAGSSGSGKSLVSIGAAKWALENNIQVILLDAENAQDKSFVSGLGIDADNPNILRIPVASPEDVATVIADFMNDYNEITKGLSTEEMPKVLFIVDSLGMLITEHDQRAFEDKGNLTGAFGTKAKQLKALCSNSIRLFTGKPIGMIATNHTSESMDIFKPGQVVSGGQGFIYAASLVVLMDKLKLKETEEGEKITEILGIKSKCQISKSRYSKPNTECVLQIPYSTGINKYSGLIDFFEKTGVLVKSGNRLEYVPKNGEPIKMYRKEYIRDHALLEKMMDEYETHEDMTNLGVGLDIEEDDDI